MTNQISIWNNDPSTFSNETSCVDSISVVDTLDVTRNLDVSLDCACSAEKVYSLCFYVQPTIRTILWCNYIHYDSNWIRNKLHQYCNRRGSSRKGIGLASRCYKNNYGGNLDCNVEMLISMSVEVLHSSELTSSARLISYSSLSVIHLHIFFPPGHPSASPSISHQLS